MKRVCSLLIAFTVTSFSPPSIANAADETLTISSPANRDSRGIFLDDSLQGEISPIGRLGVAVYRDLPRVRAVAIDMALIEEVQDLADGYSYLDPNGELVNVSESTVATNWLAALLRNLSRPTDGRTISALAYGNPDSKYLTARAPSEYRFYQEIAQARLSGFLGRDVVSVQANTGLVEDSPRAARLIHSKSRAELKRIYSIAPAPEVLSLRLELGKILNPGISNEKLVELIETLGLEVAKSARKLRVAQGSYTITSAQYELPMTIVNDFSLPVTISPKVKASNSRVLITQPSQVTVPANSQIQVALPLDVIASGQTTLEVKLRSTSGKSIGPATQIPLRLAVISPLTTWFTTGMAVLLLLAAVVQSMRRVRRRSVK